ncbi:MAG TPA: glucose 1-dehydrogenase [Phycisphaerales bacterium]|nr:glucose 1-dehydrogenase [Phycisphaerales bacterium]
MYNLKNKVALITGGTSGIGKATALALAEAGANVVLTGRREAEGEKVAGEVRARGVKGAFVRGDVTDERHIQKAVETALGINGRLDFAVNNAGIELMGVPIAETTVDNYRTVMDINVLGVVLSMKHEIRAMLAPRSGGSGGSIVNVSSIAGSISMGGMGVYSASKHAVLGLTKTAALEVSAKGIRVNAISPAAIETEMYDRFVEVAGGKEAEKQFAAAHPIGRVGKPSEIARPILFLLSDQASFITGSDLKVDGAFTAQ